MSNTGSQDTLCQTAGLRTQVKVSVPFETAAAFKAACVASNTTMTDVIIQFMGKYSGSGVVKGGYSPDLSKRRQRRAAIRSILYQLERVKENEEQYLGNIPENFQGSTAYENAEQCVSTLCEVLELLVSAY